MFDATSLLGGMLANSFGKRLASAALPGTGFSTTTKVAAGAAGVAAVGGLGYLAYRHFQGRPANPQLGAPQGQGAAPGVPTGGGFLEGIVGSSTGLQRGNFSVPGYEWQTQGAPPDAPAAAPPPPAVPFEAPAAAPPIAPSSPAQPSATMTSDQYRALPDRPQSPYATSTDFPSAQAPAQASGDSQAQALLLVRVMVAAANADGVIEDGERSNILNHLGNAGLSQAEVDGLARELDSPKPITALVGEINSPELAEQAYVVSLLAMSFQEGPSDAEKAYARMLPALLGLPAAKLAEIHGKLGFPQL